MTDKKGEVEKDKDEFETYIKQYVKYIDDISKMKIAISERQKAVNVLSPTICKFMQKYKIDRISINGGSGGSIDMVSSNSAKRGPSQINSFPMRIWKSDEIDKELKVKLLGEEGVKKVEEKIKESERPNENLENPTYKLVRRMPKQRENMLTINA